MQVFYEVGIFMKLHEYVWSETNPSILRHHVPKVIAVTQYIFLVMLESLTYEVCISSWGLSCLLCCQIWSFEKIVYYS